MSQPVFPDLRDASVFITGGASGIGAALVAGFAAQGARVAFCDLADGAAHADAVAAATGNRPLALTCDITDTAALTAAMDRAAAAHGPLRVLVNNAANDTRIPADEVTPEDWDDSLAVNLRALFFACQHAARMMRGNGGGAIVNFSSITYILGMAGISPYVTSKGGIAALTSALAREWGSDLIRVNAIAPGWVLTERQLRLWATPEALADFLPRQSLPVRMAPEDMVGPALFLASAASRMVTGQVLPVDAGVVRAG